MPSSTQKSTATLPNPNDVNHKLQVRWALTLTCMIFQNHQLSLFNTSIFLALSKKNEYLATIKLCTYMHKFTMHTIKLKCLE